MRRYATGTDRSGNERPVPPAEAARFSGHGAATLPEPAADPGSLPGPDIPPEEVPHRDRVATGAAGTETAGEQDAPPDGDGDAEPHGTGGAAPRRGDAPEAARVPEDEPPEDPDAGPDSGAGGPEADPVEEEPVGAAGSEGEPVGAAGSQADAAPPARVIGRANAVDRTHGPAPADGEDLLAGRYRLRDLVGAGGMGRVWLARDEMLDRHVAVKEIVLPTWMNPDERADLYDRTLREARAVARLNNPYVMQIFDVVYREDRPWIVMEYVPARSLYQVIQQDGGVEPREAARIGLAVLSALDAAHRAGVLHRDVKPGNVLVAHDGRVVLTDFGLATFLDGGAAMTTPGLVLGSPQYIAPERAREGVSTPATDLWSLGATLYAAIEGRSPFARSTAMATLAALAVEPPEPASHAGPLQPVLDGLLRKDPAERMGREEARDLLTGIIGGARQRQSAGTGRRATPAHAGNPPVSGTARVAPPARTAPAAGPPDDGRPRRLAGLLDGLGGGRRGARTGWMVVGAVLGVAAAVALVAGVLRGGAGAGDPPSPAPSPTPAGSARPSAVALAPISSCAGPQPAGAPAPVEAVKPGPEPFLLPRGWRWYHDQTGFRIAVRSDWHGDVQGRAVCFHDGERTLGIEQLARPVDPLAHARTDERSVKTRGLPKGYQKVRMVRSADLPVVYWEYRSTGPDGKQMHAQRTTIQTSDGRTFDVFWQTDEPDWQLDQDLLNLILPSFSA